MSLSTICEEFFAQNEVKKSKFLAYLVPFSAFEYRLKSLRQDHPKAAHIVWARRKINGWGQIEENSSDDGEPKGSSGPPVLDALRGAGLVDCAVLIVRYFGGVKLGVGGLVRAYSSSANMAIRLAHLSPYEIRDILKLFVPFNINARFEHFLAKYEVATEFNADGAVYECVVNRAEAIKIVEFLDGFSGAQILAVPIWMRDDR